MSAILCASPGLTPGGWAAEAQEDGAEAESAYSRKGADSCLTCHDSPEIESIFKTPHAMAGDARTPFAQLQCESCHGPGGEHSGRVRRGQERPYILNFGSHEPTPVPQQNEVCLGCHRSHLEPHWAGSAHEADEVACADCHSIHAAVDPVSTTATQPQVCFDCHLKQRADSLKPYVHPIRYGKMACTACHAPHGAPGESLLRRQTLNDTCYGCHTEKRGPFLWEHAPVAEDCSLCHRAHGSNHPALLTRRPPLLCQQCHAAAGHPSLAFTGAGLADDSPSAFLLAGSCTNCHAQVHGSNHPSGPRWTR